MVAIYITVLFKNHLLLQMARNRCWHRILSLRFMAGPPRAPHKSWRSSSSSASFPGCASTSCPFLRSVRLNKVVAARTSPVRALPTSALTRALCFEMASTRPDSSLTSMGSASSSQISARKSRRHTRPALRVAADPLLEAVSLGWPAVGLNDRRLRCCPAQLRVSVYTHIRRQYHRQASAYSLAVRPRRSWHKAATPLDPCVSIGLRTPGEDRRRLDNRPF